MAARQHQNATRRRRLAGAGDTHTTGPPTPESDTSTLADPDARGMSPDPTPLPSGQVLSEDTGATGAGGPDVAALMRTRLAEMAKPRDSDDAGTAAMRAILRDEALMAYVTANVDRWPPLTDEQRDTLAAILNRPANRPRRHAA